MATPQGGSLEITIPGTRNLYDAQKIPVGVALEGASEMKDGASREGTESAATELPAPTAPAETKAPDHVFRNDVITSLANFVRTLDCGKGIPSYSSKESVNGRSREHWGP